MQYFEWRISESGNQCLDANGVTCTVYQKNHGNYGIVISSRGHDPVFGSGTYDEEEDAKRAAEVELSKPTFDLDRFAYAQRWRTSRSGNEYCLVNGVICTVFPAKEGGYRYVRDGEFSQKFATLDQAKRAVDGLVGPVGGRAAKKFPVSQV